MTADDQWKDVPDVSATAQFDRIVVDPVDSVDAAEPAVPMGLSASDRAAVQALPPTSALLIVQHGPNAGARFLLDSEQTTAGRHTKADIFLDDVTVSRKHAEFIFTDGAYAVRDVGSLNGTYVNRERIDQITLRTGDEVQIGKYRLIYYPSPNRPVATESPTTEASAISGES